MTTPSNINTSYSLTVLTHKRRVSECQMTLNVMQTVLLQMIIELGGR